MLQFTKSRSHFYKLWIVFILPPMKMLEDSRGKKGDFKNEEKFKDALKHCWQKAPRIP